jgi:hypothetical protein
VIGLPHRRFVPSYWPLVTACAEDGMRPTDAMSATTLSRRRDLITSPPGPLEPSLSRQDSRKPRYRDTSNDVPLAGPFLLAAAWDTNGQQVTLYSRFSKELAVVLRPGESLSYSSKPVTIQTPERRWSTSRFNPVAVFFDDDVQTFCQQREVPGLHILQ